VDSFAAILASRPLVLDGGFATELETRGHDLRDDLWSARLLRDDPRSIVDVHRTYFEAGADLAITASYHATVEGFGQVGIGEDEARSLIRSSVTLAQQARDEAGRGGLVAGSVGPYGVVWADGSEYRGDYSQATDEQIAGTQRTRMAELVAAGADLLAIETIPNGREAAIVGDLLHEFPDTQAFISFCCTTDHALSDGTPIADAVRSATRSGRAVAVGVNCTPPQHVEALLAGMRRATDLPLLTYPNWGRVWDGDSYTWSGAGVDAFAPELVARWSAAGARAIGGCCGIGPGAITQVAAALQR
jgi:homocysteine S-methyltransferase